MASKTCTEIVPMQAAHTPEITLQESIAAEPVVTPSRELTVVEAINRKARGYFKTLQRSFSSSALERKSSLGDDPSAMTIQFLRARLQSQRAAYKAEQERAQQLNEKVLELERKLSSEVQLRQNAECGNMEVSPRRETDFIRLDNLLLYGGTVDEASKNCVLQKEEKCDVVRSKSREYSSSSVGESSDGDTDGCKKLGNLDGGEAGFSVSSREHFSYSGSPRALSGQNKEQTQSSKQCLPNHPPRIPCKEHFNALVCNETRLQQFRKMPGQAVNYMDWHALPREEQTDKKNAEQLIDALCNAHQEAKGALPALEGKHIPKKPSDRLLAQVFDMQQNVKTQFPLDMGSNEDLLKEIAQDEIAGVTRPEQNLKDVAGLHFQGKIGPTLASRSSGPIKLPSETSHAKQDNKAKSDNLHLNIMDHKSIVLEEANIPCVPSVGKNFPFTDSTGEVGNLVSKTSVEHIHPCFNDADVASTYPNFQCRPQYKTLKAELQKAADKQFEAEFMATQVSNGWNSVNSVLSENQADCAQGIVGQVVKGSECNSYMVDFNREDIVQGYSEISGEQCKQKQGRHMEFPRNGDVGESSISLLSSFKFDVPTDILQGTTAKDDFVIENSQTRKFMDHSYKEPAFHNQPWPQRQAKYMWEHSSGYPTNKTNLAGRDTFEKGSSPAENATFVGQLHCADLRNRHQAIPLSRFSNQNGCFPRTNFSYGQPKEYYARASNCTCGTTTHVSHPDVCPFMLNGMKPSNAKMPLGFISSERDSQPGCVWGGSNPQAHTHTINPQAHDRLHEHGGTQLGRGKNFQEGQLSFPKSIHENMEAKEYRAFGKYVAYPPHMHSRDTKQYTQQSLNVSQGMDSFFSVQSRNAIPTHFSNLQGEVNDYRRHKLDSMDHQMFVDDGFDRVKEILKVLDIAKQQIQTSNESTVLSVHPKAEV